MTRSVQCIFDSALSHTRRLDPTKKRVENCVVALCTLWTKFACGQVSSPRLYRLRIIEGLKLWFGTLLELYC